MRHCFAFVLFRLIIAGSVTVGQAGANPNEATRLEYDKYNNTWSFTWWGHVGNTYFIQQSDDLLSWQYMPLIIEGEDKVAEWQFSNDQNTAFVRLKYTDMPTSNPHNDDFDSDDINNWSELLQQSDPLASDDQDSNGIPDDWELFWNDQFGVFPSTVVATLTHRDSTTQQLYLNNPVSPDANFTVTLSNNLAGTQIIYDYEDNLTGGAIYNWTDISTSGTLLHDISETDNAAQEVVLNNFTFPFYGTSYDQMYVASNGLLTFGTPTADSGNDAIPYEYEPNNFIALLWDDLDTNDAIADDGGEVYFQEFADRIIVQYERVMRDSDSDRSTQSNTFQVVLHASGLIDVHYKEIGGHTGSATVGIEDSSGTNGIEVFYNGYRTIYPTFELSNGLALSYTPQSAKFVQVSPLTGTTTTGSSSTLEVNFNSYDLAPGTYTANIDIAHTGTGTTPWIITAVLEVINTPATINLYQPLDGQVYWSDETVTFSAYVYDSDFGIERVDYLVNGAVEDQDISGSYYSGSWSPTVGQHEVIARAVDLYGTTTDSVVVTITVLGDSDFDRMDDAWEQQHFGSLNQEASADFDGDGIPNIFEYNHGTDPANALSKLTFAETQTSDYTYFLVDETLATETDVAKTSLSAAINRANDFDVIEVRPGTYHEALDTLYDRLYVFGTAGARNTTIDTSGLDDRALTLRSESVFSGLSFRGADPEYTYFDGGAVYLSISGDQNKPRFIGCRFIDNIVGDRGGAIYIGSGDPLFIACTIAGNLGGNGSAIYNSSSSNTITLVNTLLWNPGNSTEIDGQTASVIFDHSLARGVTSGNVLIHGVDQGTDDPGLAFDYSLAAGSIARDRGSLGAYSDYSNLPDCDGEAVLATRDIGADEFIDSDGDGLPDWIERQAGIDLNATDDNDLDLLNNLEDYENMGNPFLDDTDGDGLLDGDEFYADGTHGDTDGYTTGVNNPDTDDDNLGDGWEVQNELNPVDPSDATSDSDADDLSAFEELILGTDPNNADTDGDGLSDSVESTILASIDPNSFYYLDPTNPDTDGDGINDGLDSADGDDLSNLDELALGTNPNLADTDADGVNDRRELDLGFDPTSFDDFANQDSDNDGLNDLFEIDYGTDPNDADTNDNGMDDGEELDNGGDPINPGPPPEPLDPGDPPTPDPPTPEPESIVTAQYDILIESKSIHFPKYGHSTFESVDPAKRYLTLSAQQSFSGGCPESGPENVNGSRSIDIDPVTGESTTSGDRYVNAGGTADSPTRKSGQTQSSSYDDPPNEKTDCEGTIRYFSTLSNENTTTMMQSNGKSELEDYEDTFVNGTPYAHQNTHANELRYDYRKTQFKFKWQADTDEEAKFPVKYFVLFTPEDDPDTTETNESTEVEIVGEPIQWNGSGDESPVFELDPDTLKSGEDGTFRLLKVELGSESDEAYKNKSVYRGDPLRNWSSHSTDLNIPNTNVSLPISAHPTLGDYVNYKAYHPGIDSSVITNYKWSAVPATGYNNLTTIEGPNDASASEWKIEDGGVDWKSGKYDITLELTFNGGTTAEVTKEQTVWQRTDDVLVVGYIDEAFAPVPGGANARPIRNDVDGDVEAPYTMGEFLSPLRRGAFFINLGSGGYRTPFEPDVARRYLNRFVLQETANVDPPSHFQRQLSNGVFVYDEAEINDFFSEDTNYRAINRLQAEYLLDESGDIVQGPEIITKSIYRTNIGDTPHLAWSMPAALDPTGAPEVHPGSGVINTDGSTYDFHHVTHSIGVPQGFAQYASGRVGSEGQYMNGLINGGGTPWIYGLIEFEGDAYGPEHSDIVRQIFPTYWVYINGALDESNKFPQSDPELFIQLGNSL